MASNDRKAQQEACEVTLRFPTSREAELFQLVWERGMGHDGNGVKMINWEEPNRGRYEYFVGHVVKEI